MLDPAHFQSAALIDDQVPDRFGLYAIRTRDLAALPDPYRAIAEERCSDLIYLGEATGQTLRRRFFRNELRGHGHGTFFRSLGAVLGYRPPAGSLLGKANQRNLDVSWVAFDEGVHNAVRLALQRAGDTS